MNLRDDAEELAIALILGFATVDEAVRWADAEIAAHDGVPCEPLIEVSCGAALPALEVAHVLRSIPGAVDVQRASRRVIGRMAAALDNGHASVEHITGALYTMYLEGWTPDEQAATTMVGLDDARDFISLRWFLRQYGA